MSVTVRDKGMTARIRKILAGAPLVVAGVLEADGAAAKEDGDGLTVAEVAKFHEFGLGSNPERSFIRHTVDNQRADFERLLRRAARRIAEGHDADKEMGIVGAFAQGAIKERILSNIPPELKEATKKRKQREMGGGSKDVALIKTGQLLSSIHYELRGRNA